MRVISALRVALATSAFLGVASSGQTRERKVVAATVGLLPLAMTGGSGVSSQIFSDQTKLKPGESFKKIMILDDQSDGLLTGLRRSFVGQGYEVHVLLGSSQDLVQAALDLYRNNSDLTGVISDVDLPEENLGFEIEKKLREAGFLGAMVLHSGGFNEEKKEVFSRTCDTSRSVFCSKGASSVTDEMKKLLNAS